MATVEFHPATPEVAKVIAQGMRKADVDEVVAASGLSPEKAVEVSIRTTAEPMCMFIDGEPACVFGVGQICFISGSGAPWMLGTDILEKKAKHWLPFCEPVLKSMFNQYNELENYVDVRNKKSIRWLKWLGFKFDKPKPYGKAGRMFMRFYMVRS